MASESPEDTTGNAWEGDDGYGATGYHQSAHTEPHSLHQTVHESTISVDPAPIASGESPSPSDADEDGDDGDEYDPESVTATATAPTPVAASTSKKPKKAGGFIVGSSDDEDDTSTPPAPTPAPSTTPAPNTLKPPASDTPQRAPSHSPLQQTITPTEAQASSNGQDFAQPAPPAPPVVPAAPVNSLPKARLPADIIGILEDRVRDDPRGDMDAWLALMEEYRRRNVIHETRAVYERFLQLFPQAAEIWVRYVEMELSLDNFSEAERIFERTLMAVPHIQLWTAYLDYVRRRNDLSEPTGVARQTVGLSYDFVLNNIGQDRDSGRIWQDYIQFLRSGPGQIGGTSWQDMQKIDILRKAYQRAICVPMANVHALWKEYNQFEMGLNSAAGRKFITEMSPAYMSAKSANTYLDNTLRGLNRSTLPRLPPAPGFEGDQEYLEQVELWKRWIAWEKDDPLVLRQDEPEVYRQRIIHVYKQALIPLRFWPELWVDAAESCFENNVIKDGQDIGLEFLVEGVGANPESSLLALKHADRIESTHQAGEGDDAKIALGQAVRAPYDKVLTSLYEIVQKLKDREKAALENIENDPTLAAANNAKEDEEDEGEVVDNPMQDTKRDRTKAVQEGFAVQIQMLSQHISYLWIALVRAFRRIQGQGKVQSKEDKDKPQKTGVRGIFTEARSKGRLTSDVYAAVAHIEWDIYQDPVATKIFERGAKLFPEDEHFMVAYLKHLHSRHDTTNARVVFSQTAKRFKEKRELVPRLKPLYSYFHGYEAKFGELQQIKELEKQMTECFPEDPSLAHFAARFATERFNPILARVIISPTAQMRPKNVMQSIEQRAVSVSARGSPQPSIQYNSPRPQFTQQVVNSPKRPFVDDFDDYPPRKLARGVSPLKGAAGRRLDQQRRAAATPAAPLPSMINFLLGEMPPSRQYEGQRYRPDGVVRLIRDLHVPDSNEWKAMQSQAMRGAPAVPDWHGQRNQPTPVWQGSNQWGGQWPAGAQWG